MGLQRGAHIAAVPLNGQDSLRAERRITPRINDIGRCPVWLVVCTITLEFSFVSRESDLLVQLIHRSEMEPLDLHNGSCDQQTPQLAKEGLWQSS
jgi:hypothetical protein